MSDARDPQAWVIHAAQQMETPPLTWEDHYPAKIKPFLPAWTKVLDFGCGTGRWRGCFRDGEYVGYDQSREMILGAIQRWDNDGRFVLGNPPLPFDAASFDLIFTAAVLQHNLDEFKPPLFSEFHRVLMAGGHLLLLENTVGDWNPGREDGYSHTAEGWRAAVEPHGFVCVSQFEDVHLFRKV